MPPPTKRRTFAAGCAPWSKTSSRERPSGERTCRTSTGLPNLWRVCRPVRAGRFVVHGSHDRACVRPGELAIEIDAAQAFGTGHHGTTAGCLEMIGYALRQAPVSPGARPRHRQRRAGDRHPQTGPGARAGDGHRPCRNRDRPAEPSPQPRRNRRARRHGRRASMRPPSARKAPSISSPPTSWRAR